MKKLYFLTILFFSAFLLKGQTPLTEAVNFHVKTIEGTTIYLFPILDNDNIVVIDFFSTTCGPCQTYAPDFQEAYEEFGENQSNVFFVGINWGDDNDGVHEFDSVFGLTFPSVSGIQGGGNYVYEDYQIEAYPTVIVITPDHQIVEQHVWPPTAENIIEAVIAAGGMYVDLPEEKSEDTPSIIYPNPADDHIVISVQLARDSQLRYEIYDLMGNLVQERITQGSNAGINNLRLPVHHLKSGLYFVKIIHDNKVLKTHRVLISH